MQIEIIKFIQQIANPFWDCFFTFVSILGEETMLIALLGLVYWCIDKKLGYKIGFLYVLNAPLNFILKGIFNAPRPIGEPGVRTIYADTATGSSFPSGHSQLGGGLFYLLFKSSKEKACKVAFLIIAILIPISRVYLGVHYPVDVIVGFAIGAVMVYATGWIFEKIYENHTIWFVAFSLPALVYAVADKGEDACKLAGLIIAFLIGLVIEKRYIDFPVKGKTGLQTVKYICGVTLVLILRSGMKVLLPDTVLSGFIRYFVIGLCVTIVYPYIIKRVAQRIN